MIIDLLTILGISDSNPIQFYAPARETYNERKIKLIPRTKYFQKFFFNETLYMRFDVAFNSARYSDWDVAIEYNTGDVVYDPVGLTRRVSTSDANIGNDPYNDASTWESVDPAVTLYDPMVMYAAGDRVIYTYTPGYRIAQSLVDGNLGNDPPDGGANGFWEQVQENSGQVVLRLHNGDDISLPFENIRAGSTHQSVNFLWSAFADLADKRTYLDIYDPVVDAVLAKTDCIDIYTYSPYPSVNIIYTNSDDFDGINYATVNPQFYIRVDAVFETETHPADSEDLDLANGNVVSLRTKIRTKKLLDMIEYMPEVMHRKMEHIFAHDYIEIDEQPYKKDGEEYQRAPVEFAQLSRAQVLLTQANSVLINLSRYNPYSAGRVFSGEFSEPFS